jgi:3-dehydroquinate synthase
MNSKRIQVKSSAGNYQILCGANSIQNAAKEIATLGTFSTIHVLSSPNVWRALGNKLTRSLPKNTRSNLHLFNDAEQKKNMRTVETVCRSLTRARADRKSLLIAVGGGVVGDVAGYVAASYLRGVALVHIPTTLVAQVDSAIGGKTGVNLPEGKNLVGAFYPPRLVIIDPQLLRTLPQRQFRSGLAEVIKYGVIADKNLFAYLEKSMPRVLQRDKAALNYLIPRCAQIKATIVSRDERESNLREILNFGHTFGHALESITRYRRYQHGEAVAQGMIAVALLAHELGLSKADNASRIISLVQQIGPLPPWPRVAPEKLIAAMRSDKKAHAGNLRFVLSPRIGHAQSTDAVPMKALKTVLRFLLHSPSHDSAQLSDAAAIGKSHA